MKKNKQHIATVGDLISHLQKFDKDAKLCFWDEGGAHMECVHVLKNMLGDMMFKTILDDKIRRKNTFNESDKDLIEHFEFVDDNDVLIY